MGLWGYKDVTIALACDGPYNGQYIDSYKAFQAGYALRRWPNGESVWMQP